MFLRRLTLNGLHGIISQKMILFDFHIINRYKGVIQEGQEDGLMFGNGSLADGDDDVSLQTYGKTP
jgi:hypothetical protein